MSSKPPSLMFANSLMIIYDSASLSSEISLPIFPVQFSFSSCFLFLRFEISPNSSCDIEQCSRQERDKGVWRRKSILGLLPVFLRVKVFPTKGNFMETHNCTPYSKSGVESLKAPSGGIFHNRPVHRVKNWYTHQGLYSFFQLSHQEPKQIFQTCVTINIYFIFTYSRRFGSL